MVNTFFETDGKLNLPQMHITASSSHFLRRFYDYGIRAIVSGSSNCSRGK